MDFFIQNLQHLILLTVVKQNGKWLLDTYEEEI